MTKTPQAGEWWIDDKSGKIFFIVGRSHNGTLVVQYQVLFGLHIDSVDYLFGWHHEPRCAGFDWVEPVEPVEVWPVYCATEEIGNAYIRIEKNGDVFVVRENGNVVKSYRCADSFSDRKRITEAEALAMVEKPAPVESPEDWVTQDRVPARVGIDQFGWSHNSYWNDVCSSHIENYGTYWNPVCSWHIENYGTCLRHGWVDPEDNEVARVRCKRKDLPPLQSEPTKKRVEVRLWCRYERGNKTGHMYVFANTDPPVGAGIKYSEIHSDGNNGWFVEVPQ